MTVLKTYGGSTSSSPQQVDNNIYPVPTMQFLVNQSIATASQPNNLCYDDNLFIKCSCAYARPVNATITDDKIDIYFSKGLTSPVQSLFSTAHSLKAYSGVCLGIISAAVQNPLRVWHDQGPKCS